MNWTFFFLVEITVKNGNVYRLFWYLYINGDKASAYVSYYESMIKNILCYTCQYTWDCIESKMELSLVEIKNIL